MVALPFSYTWEIVSIPDPVASIYAIVFASKICRVLAGKPLGLRLMCEPVSGAEAKKKTCCFNAHDWRSGGM